MQQTSPAIVARRMSSRRLLGKTSRPPLTRLMGPTCCNSIWVQAKVLGALLPLKEVRKDRGRDRKGVQTKLPSLLTRAHMEQRRRTRLPIHERRATGADVGGDSPAPTAILASLDSAVVTVRLMGRAQRIRMVAMEMIIVVTLLSANALEGTPHSLASNRLHMMGEGKMMIP